MTTQMRLDFQLTADAYLRRKIISTSGLDIDGDLVSILVGYDDSITAYLKNRAAVAPLRRAGFKLTPFRLRNGRAEIATSGTADGWEIDEGVES